MKNKLGVILIVFAVIHMPWPLFAEQLEGEHILSRTEVESQTIVPLPLQVADEAVEARSLKVALAYQFDDVMANESERWSFSVTYKVGSNKTFSLTISKNGSDEQVLQASHTHNLLAFGSSFQIVSHEDTPLPHDSGLGPAPSNIQLRLIVSEETYTRYDRDSNPPRMTIGPDIIRWTPVASVEDYDLEWVFFDARRINGEFPSNPFLKKQPVRATVINNTYPKDTSYTQGRVYYRVRAVGRHPCSGQIPVRRPGRWSEIQVVDIAGDTGFESNRNWQFLARYNMVGQRNTSVTYYDGTFRPRQTVRDISSEGHCIVSETKYDFEGRPAVNFLPTPVPGVNLGYRPSFNRTDDGVFTAADFDKQNPSPVSSDSGAGRYYSYQNDFTTDKFRDYVPDSSGYPYSLKRYYRDGLDRLRSISAAGGVFVPLPSYHKKFVYGAAEAKQLKKMFGSNAGPANRYEKQIQIDQNGQTGVSYLDQMGNTVATTLAGGKPPQLIPLESYPGETNQIPLQSFPLNDLNEIDTNEGKSLTIAGIINEASKNYQFTYKFEGVNYKAGATGLFPEKCIQYEYRLKVQINDPSGGSVPLTLTSPNPNTIPSCEDSTSSPVCKYDNGQDTISLEFRPNIAGGSAACDTLAEECSEGLCGTQAERTVTFNAFFDQVGTYTLAKSLVSIGEEDAIEEVSTSTVTNVEELIEKYQESTDFSGCNFGMGCDAICQQEHPNGLEERNDCVDDCEDAIAEMVEQAASNQCDFLLRQIQTDVSPGGILFENDAWVICAL